MSRLAVNMHQNLTSEIINLLFAKGIYTITDFVNADVKHLASILSVPYQEVLTIRNHLVNKNSGLVLNARNYYLNSLRTSAIFSTGIQQLDNLLKGGLRTQNIYEICGLPNSGKTQICLTICKNVAENLGNSLIYLDTKGDFSAKRIKSMITKKEIIGNILEKILVSRINTLQDLINSLYAIRDNIKNYNVRIIIIDSLPVLLYPYTDVTQKYMHLNHAVNIMRVLSKQYNLIILVTNVLTFYVKSFTEVDVEEFLGSGKYWNNVPNVRIKIDKREVDWELSILKSTYFNSNGKSAFVKITQNGVQDV